MWRDRACTGNVRQLSDRCKLIVKNGEIEKFYVSRRRRRESVGKQCASKLQKCIARSCAMRVSNMSVFGHLSGIEKQISYLVPRQKAAGVLRSASCIGADSNL